MKNYKKITKEAYDKSAEFFIEKFEGLYEGHIVPHISRFAEMVGEGDILDLGAGSGSHVFLLSEKGGKVFCVDNSEKMVSICKEKGFDAEVMDLEALRFGDERFEGVWSSMSLIHVPKQKIAEVVESIKRILKKNGLLFVTVKEGEGEKFVQEEGTDVHRFISYWIKDEFVKAFEGFELLDSGKIPMTNRNYLYFYFRKLA